MTISSQTICFEARCKCGVGFIHAPLASSYANAPQQLASSRSTVGFITRDFHALISRQHSQTNRHGLYTLFLTSKSRCMQKISSGDALLTTQNVLSRSGRFGGGHTGWSQLQLASSVSPLWKQGDRVSAAMMLVKLSWSSPVSAYEGLCYMAESEKAKLYTYFQTTISGSYRSKDSISKHGTPTMKIRRSWGHLIFIMWILYWYDGIIALIHVQYKITSGHQWSYSSSSWWPQPLLCGSHTGSCSVSVGVWSLGCSP